MSRRSIEVARGREIRVQPLPPEMNGWLAKRGRRSGQNMKRYFKLTGSMLTNHRNELSPATWQVDVAGSKVIDDPARHMIMIQFRDSSFILTAFSKEECAQWTEALQRAAKQAVPDRDAPYGLEMAATPYKCDTFGDDDEVLSRRRSLQFSGRNLVAI